MSIFGEAKDGKRFDAESPEVKEYMEKFPEVGLELAIGSVIMNYDRGMTLDEALAAMEDNRVAGEEVVE